MTSAEFAVNLKQVQERIEKSCERAGRAISEVKLLPVTKNHGPESVGWASELGLTAVGENRVQEALIKMESCPRHVAWELIGPLQSNKAKKAAERFARIQTVDREKIVHTLDIAAEGAARKLRILLQINAGRDPAKSGADLESADRLVETVLRCQNLLLEGLMTIAPLDDSNPDTARRCFAQLRECRDRLSRDFGLPLSELSMGMSGDLDAAIAEGSTLVRVGTALFGERQYSSLS